MKVILKPKVTVVSVPTFLEHPNYAIPDDGTDIERLGGFAAKGCYDSYSKTGRPNKDNGKVIIESKHGSVLEHSNISVFVEGITRGCSLEMNRHRGLAISQRSTRYTSEDDAAIVLDPYYAMLFKKYDFFEQNGWYVPRTLPNVRTNEVIEMNLILDHLKMAQSSFHRYDLEVDDLMALNPYNLSGTDLRKWSRGKARNILPHGLETRATYTANMRTWRWIIELRSERHAEAEIRRLANAIYSAIQPYAPLYFEDFDTTEIYDGIPELKPRHSKI